MKSTGRIEVTAAEEGATIEGVHIPCCTTCGRPVDQAPHLDWFATQQHRVKCEGCGQPLVLRMVMGFTADQVGEKVPWDGEKWRRYDNQTVSTCSGVVTVGVVGVGSITARQVGLR